MVEHIIIILIINFFGALCFWGFIVNLNKKNYFSSGSYLFSLIGTIVMLIEVIMTIKQ